MFTFLIYGVCVCVRVRVHMQAPDSARLSWLLWWSEISLWECVPFFHHVNPGIELELLSGLVACALPPELTWYLALFLFHILSISNMPTGELFICFPLSRWRKANWYFAFSPSDICSLRVSVLPWLVWASYWQYGLHIACHSKKGNYNCRNLGNLVVCSSRFPNVSNEAGLQQVRHGKFSHDRNYLVGAGGMCTREYSSQCWACWRP